MNDQGHVVAWVSLTVFVGAFLITYFVSKSIRLTVQVRQYARQQATVAKAMMWAYDRGYRFATVAELVEAYDEYVEQYGTRSELVH